MNLLATTQIIINIRDFASNVMILWHNSSNHAVFTNMTLEHENYHFAFGGDFLVLISKITKVSYLHEFHEYGIYFTI